MLLAGFLITSLINCGVKPPKVTTCSIVNVNTAQCVPADPRKEEFDLNLNEMLGYACYSPEDIGEVKKFVQKVLDRMDSVELRGM